MDAFKKFVKCSFYSSSDAHIPMICTSLSNQGLIPWSHMHKYTQRFMNIDGGLDYFCAWVYNCKILIFIWARQSRKEKENKWRWQKAAQRQTMKKKHKVKPKTRFALFTELVCSPSPYKQLTDTGLKPMRPIILHKASCQHHTVPAKYSHKILIKLCFLGGVVLVQFHRFPSPDFSSSSSSHYMCNGVRERKKFCFSP